MNTKRDSDIRKEADEKFKELSSKMRNRRPSSSDQWLTYEEALHDFLPAELREYCNSPAYRFLCVQLRNYLESDFSRENIQALELARESFVKSVEIEKEKKHHQHGMLKDDV